MPRKMYHCATKPLKKPHREQRYKFEIAFSTFINIGHYIGFIPFRIRLLETTNHYYIAKNCFQRVICGILHILALVMQVLHFSTFVDNRLHKDPSLIYGLLNSGSILCFLLSYFWLCWKHEERVLDVVNMVPCHSANVSVSPTQFKKVVSATCFWLLFEFTNTLIEIFLSSGFLISPSNLTRFIEKFFYSAFHIYLHQLVIGIFGTGIFVNYFLCSYIFLIAALSTYAIWEITNDLFKTLDVYASEITCPSHIINNIIVAQGKVGKVNLATGNVFLFNFLVTFFISCTLLECVVNPSSPLSLRIFLTIACFRYVSVMLAAGKSLQVFQSFRQQLLVKLSMSVIESPMQVDTKWLCLYVSTNSFDFGVNASNFFTVSYSLLGMASSIVLTYFLVLIQGNQKGLN